MTVAATTRVQKKLQFGMCSLPLLCRFEHAFSIIEKAWIQELIRVHDLDFSSKLMTTSAAVAHIFSSEMFSLHLNKKPLSFLMARNLMGISRIKNS